MGHSRRFDRVQLTSGLTPQADIIADRRHVSKVPTTELALIRSSRLDSIFLRWSFGQSGSPQSFFEPREAFALIRAQHVFESGNTQRGIEFPLPSHCLMCLLRPPGHRVACGGEA